MSNQVSVHAVTSDNLEQVLASTEGAVLLKFWAPWCSPCRQLEPVVRSLVAGMQDRMILAKVNIDLYIDVAKRFNVRTVPTLLLVKSGQEVARLATGSYTLEQLQQELEPHL
jgi:thioredoxin 1